MLFTKQTRILVVAAHPDDEVLGCGGTLGRAIAHGATVSVLFLGEGVAARFDAGKYDGDEYKRQSRIRNEGALKALESLQISDVHFNTRYCCQFDQYPFLELVKEIEREMTRFQPTMLFTHNPIEVNIDHRLTYLAVENACRPTRSVVPKEIYTFEIVCSGGWTFAESFKPNIYVDISQYWEAKLKAWRCYEGEERPFPFPRCSKGLEVLAQYRGMAVGLEYAEAFKLVRKII